MQSEIQSDNAARGPEARPAIYDRLDQARVVSLIALNYLHRPLGIIGVFSVALAIVGFFYFVETREQDAIEARIDESRSILTLTAPDLEQLQLRLEGWDYSRALALDGRIDGVATAPLNKEAANLAGHAEVGHQEIYQKMTGAERVMTMLLAPGLRVVHLTTHLSLRDACDAAAGVRFLDVLDHRRARRRAAETLALLGLVVVAFAMAPAVGMCGSSPMDFAVNGPMPGSGTFTVVSSGMSWIVGIR